MVGSMKTKEIAKTYGIDQNYFENWLKNSKYSSKSSTFGGMELTDETNIEQVISEYKAYHAEQRQKYEDEQANIKEAEQRKQEALSSMLITSGFSFDGYTITRYSGYISGDDAVQVDRGTGGFFGNVTDVGASLMESLVKIRRQALYELKEAAFALGCNAVIGVDFDYLTLDPETAGSNGGTLYLPYVFGVTANGNAVFIEKNN
jgi:uncharacterized protein YbjQ (UPF0145 family)